MKLLSTAARMRLSLTVSLQAVFTALVGLSLLSLEFIGRKATSDVQDSVYALFLLGVAGIVVLWHRRRPLNWVNWLARRGFRFLDWAKGLKADHGIDFRGTPPLPRRIPNAAWGLAFALIVWGAIGVAIGIGLPGGWRVLGTTVSYVVYLLVILAAWGVLLGSLMAGLFLPMLALDRHLTESFSNSDRRLIVLVASLLYLVALTAAAAFLPMLIPLVLSGVGLLFAIAWAARPDRSDVAIVWRDSGDRRVYSIPIHRVVGGAFALGLLGLIALILNGRGGRFLTSPEAIDPMPLTASLAALAAWTMPGLLAIAWIRIREKQHSDPSNRTPPSLHLTNKLSPEAGEHAATQLRDWGWTVRVAPTAPEPGDVKIELVHPEMSEATEFNPYWPLKIAPVDLTNPLVRDRLVRRDEIRCRRAVFKGLTKLLKKAIAGRKKRGGGFWLAPHWWFIDGLGREEAGRKKRTSDGEADVLHRVGPPFARIFDERSRQHLHRVLRAVQIDVIYIEDAVPLKAVVQVLRTVFEVFDIHDGKRIVDDHSFQGIPKVRAMVHEFSPVKTVVETGRYKQPKFDELSRGRVLHLFRDKGDMVAEFDRPRDFDSVPSPMLVG